MKNNDLKIAEKRFRPELEGVRALAALLVAIYHVWLGKVSGGVDIFFVVSGYLITTSLLNRVMRAEKLNFKDYYLGLTRRLFPLAYTVVTAVVLLSIFYMPKSLWQDVIPQAFASIFYYENWQLTWNSVDYLANNDTNSSPFQHFWALSLQGQFYITWPIVISIAYLLAKKLFKSGPRKTLLVVLIILSSISFIYSVYLTNVNQPYAYFNTFARAWEFGMGGILSLILPYIKPGRITSYIIGWLGVAILLFTGMVIPVSTLFPGYVALLPISAAMMIIISAERELKFSAGSFLSLKPLQKFGGISYAFYLWHWPLLTFYYTIFNVESAGIIDGLAILFIAFLLSLFTSRVIEKPIRSINITKQMKKMTIVSSTLLLIVSGIATSWVFMNKSLQNQIVENMGDYPGALSIYYDKEEPEVDEYIPNFAVASRDVPSFYSEEDCFSHMDSEGTVVECTYGETENPIATVALVGGSHSGHWFPALEKIATEEKIELKLLNRDACRFSNDDFGGKLTEQCMVWNEKVTQYLKDDPVDIIFTTANTDSDDIVPEGYHSLWKEFEGITTVFAVRDNPRMSFKPPLCIEQNNGKPDQCTEPQSEKLSETLPWENTEDLPNNVEFADLSEYFCMDGECPSVVGNVIIYRDEHHLTATYSETLTEPLKEVLMPVVKKVIESK